MHDYKEWWHVQVCTYISVGTLITVRGKCWPVDFQCYKPGATLYHFGQEVISRPFWSHSLSWKYSKVWTRTTGLGDLQIKLLHVLHVHHVLVRMSCSVMYKLNIRLFRIPYCYLFLWDLKFLQFSKLQSFHEN